MRYHYGTRERSLLSADIYFSNILNGSARVNLSEENLNLFGQQLE